MVTARDSHFEFMPVIALVLVALTFRCHAVTFHNPQDPRANSDDVEGRALGVDVSGDIDNDDYDSRFALTTWSIGDIAVVTVETRAGTPMTLPGFPPAAGKGDTEVRNVGVGEPWHYYRTKNGLMLRWLNETMARNPTKMAIMIDGSDMVFGGCDEVTILERYNKIVGLSDGARIVASAEVACYPQDMSRTFRESEFFEARRLKMLEAHGLSTSWVDKYARCKDWKAAPCDAERAYRYLNWGWVMGPAEDLQKLFTFVYHNGRRHELDQKRAMLYMIDNPSEVTLDYAGNLVLSLHGLVYGGPDEEAPLEVADINGKRAIRSKVTGATLCFSHGNGDGEGFINRLSAMLANQTGV